MSKVVPLHDRPAAVDERPGVVLLRNSTPKQIDNPRSVKAEQIARELLEKRGIQVGAVLNEQGTSGKDLSRRPIAKKLVDELEAGKWAALSVIETSRTSRDPDGVDQRIFKRACRRGRALLLTESKAYDFRNDSDDLQYEVEAVFSAREWRILRRRTWQGSVERARITPVFFGFAPFGYRAVAGTSTIRGTQRTVRLLERDPAHAPLMTAIGEALDAEDGLQAAAKRLNGAGMFQPNGHPWYWSQIQRVFESALYIGRWEFGTHREAEDLWEEIKAPIAHEMPELAWFTEERVARWRRKFTGKGPIRVRPQGWPHPLLGVLVCCYCRRPMISQGNRGYACTQARLHACRGQNLSNPQAEGAVRALLGEVLPNLADLTRRVQAILESDARPDLPGDVRALDREISARFELATESKLRGAGTPTDFFEKVKELQARRDTLADQLADLDRAEAERRRLVARAGQFTDPDAFLAIFERMTAGEQQAALRELFTWIVVDTNGGRGNRAKAWVSEYEATFPKSVSEVEPWNSWLNRFAAAS